MPSRRVPPERRKRTEISCDKCKSRKQKCHRLLSELQDGYDSRAPCRYCQTHGFECVTTQTRKKRVFATVEESLESRVKLLESLVKGLVPDADTSSVDGLRALGESLGIPVPEPQQLQFNSRSSDTPAGIEASSSSDHAETEKTSGSEVVIAGQETGAHQQQDEAHRKAEEQLPVLRDQQGRMQYIGPASSYIFQIRMRAILAGRNSHYQSQGQFFLFGSKPTDKAWVGKVADFGRGLGAAGRTSPHQAGKSPASDDGKMDDNNSYDADDDAEDDEDPPQSEDNSMLYGPVPDRLVDAFFERIHPDFPVLSEDCFRQEYARFRQQHPSQLASNNSSSNPEFDASWVCSLLCVLMLARRTVPLDDNILPMAQGQEAEDRWWRKVQALLPSVVFTSCMQAVQALLLAALHLNNTNNKDSCWTLTGAAVRISIAIGLHRDTKYHHFSQKYLRSKNNQTAGSSSPSSSSSVLISQDAVLLLRKRIWWTLYQFELMQAAALDRPSAIDDAACNTSAVHQPLSTPGAAATTEYSTRLLRMLSQACRVVRAMNHSSASGEATEDAYNGPLSPAASLIRDMRRWKDSLPRELSQNAIVVMHSSSNSHGPEGSHDDLASKRARRALLLLHVQYHHILCVITRNPMLTTVSRLFDSSIIDNNNSDDNNNDRRSHCSSNLGVPEDGSSGCNAFFTDVCISAAQESARLLFRLDADGLFDQTVWWDFYFLYQAAQVLVLGVMYDAKRGDGRRQPFANHSSSRLNISRMLLNCCAELAVRVAQNPLVPGTIHRFAVVVSELVLLVEDFIQGPGVSTIAVHAPPIASHEIISSRFAMPGSGSLHQHLYNHHIVEDPNIINDQASQMELVDHAVTTFQDSDGIRDEDAGDDLSMAETPSDIQFPADMAAHFGFPDGSWTYREGQWNEFGNMILGGGYGS
ncbi:hypothetical protein PG987_012023 [Apiospora arundinis]